MSNELTSEEIAAFRREYGQEDDAEETTSVSAPKIQKIKTKILNFINPEVNILAMTKHLGKNFIGGEQNFEVIKIKKGNVVSTCKVVTHERTIRDKSPTRPQSKHSKRNRWRDAREEGRRTKSLV